MTTEDSNQCTYSLAEWLAQREDKDFPPHGGMPYPRRFKNVAELLNDQTHPHVTHGASLADGGFLTDHGPGHIDSVIRRATSLLCYPKKTFPQVTPYEVYILLLAIHFHDVGNIFGREGHEMKHGKVMDQFDAFIGPEMVERQAIQKIASVHSGRINGSQDTISTLHPEAPVLGHKIRYRLLAAILRFADELADDSHRATRIIQSLGIIPSESMVFHEYAKSLHSVVVNPGKHVVRLNYAFLKKEATRTFGKGKLNGMVPEVYLLDEIYERTLKMHMERKYCMRFLREVVRIDAIEILIEVYEDRNSPSPCFDPIGYRLEDRGYPRSDATSVKDICPHVTVDGATLNSKLTSR